MQLKELREEELQEDWGKIRQKMKIKKEKKRSFASSISYVTSIKFTNKN